MTDTISQDLLKAAKNGDASSQNKIILQLSPMLKRIVSRYFIMGGDRDDLLQEAMIGLHKAITTYDASKKCEFITFAKTCIHNKIISAINEAAANKHRPLNASLELEAITQFSYDGPMDRMITRERLESALTLLSKKEKQVLVLYLDGLSYKQISSALQISEKSVSNALCRIRSKFYHS